MCKKIFASAKIVIRLSYVSSDQRSYSMPAGLVLGKMTACGHINYLGM